MRSIFSSPISSVTTGPRQTNMELLRLMAMALTLVAHANFYSLGEPTVSEINDAPVVTIFRMLIEAFGTTGANCFILISGWFLIKPAVKGACGFVFQCIFYILGLYILGLLFGQIFFDGRNINSDMIFSQQYWFIASYMGLYILSPVLNSFLRQASDRSLLYVLCAFYGFQTIGGMTGQIAYFFEGYSILPFVGLYMLGNWLRRLYERGSMNKKWRLLYLGPVINATVGFICPEMIQTMMLNILNPLLIAGSVALLADFSMLKVHHSSFVNHCSRSCFAIYIISCTQWVLYTAMFPVIRKIYSHYSPLESLGIILVYLVLFMMVCILADQGRIWLWEKTENTFIDFESGGFKKN